jgi:hypothetical protein
MDRWCNLSRWMWKTYITQRYIHLWGIVLRGALRLLGRIISCYYPILPPHSLYSPPNFLYTDTIFFSLAGSGESGKSTIVKQMKIIHQKLLTYHMTVHRNLVDSAQAIVLAMRKIGIDCETPSNWVSQVLCFLLDILQYFLVRF